jgi:hypothetical protein
MARLSWSREQWELHGVDAIIDLVQTKGVVTRGELEARIAVRGWKEYRNVQPIQLSGSLRRLLDEDPPRIVVETTSHPDERAVRTLRVPFTEGQKRRVERLRGRKRKSYLRYISWAQQERLCGRYGEHVVFETLLHASPRAGLWVPPQEIGDVTEVGGVPLSGGQSLDMWAWIVRDPSALAPEFDLPMVIEVKNVHHWLYADAPELWQLLVKAARLALTGPVLPLLACCWSGPTAWAMAYDVGFFSGQMREQVFSPLIDHKQFRLVRADTCLVISQHEGPLPTLERWLVSDLRKPPPSPPQEDIAWYARQAQRFAVLAPHVLDFKALSYDLEPEDRRNIFAAWRQRVISEATWPLNRGW